MGQGQLFALTIEQLNSLLACRRGQEVMEWVNNIEETLQPPYCEFLFKEWPLVQSCLSDGTCNPKGGSYPLNHCILGGQHLLPPNDGYMAVLIKPSEVTDIDEALAMRDRRWFRERFRAFFPTEERISEIALDQLCDLFEAIKAFYHNAAKNGWAILFTTDETLDAIYKA